MPSAYESAIMSFLTYEYLASKNKNKDLKERDSLLYQKKQKRFPEEKDRMSLLFFDANEFFPGSDREKPFVNTVLEYLSEKGWQLYLEPDDPDFDGVWGYLGLAFINSGAREIVIAHRGTVLGFDLNSEANYGDDIELLKGQDGKIPNILDLALAFIVKVIQKKEKSKKYQEYVIHQTGHSLGGFIAEFGAAYLANPNGFPDIQCASSFRDANSITFDSLGAANILKKCNIPEGAANTINYLPGPSIVNTANPHDGERRLLLNTNNEGLNVDGTDYSSYVFIDKNKAINIEEVIETVQMHSLQTIMKAFNPQTGEPYAYRGVDKWPTARNDFEKSEAPPQRTQMNDLDDFVYAGAARATHALTGLVSFTHKREGTISFSGDIVRSGNEGGDSFLPIYKNSQKSKHSMQQAPARSTSTPRR